MQHWEAIKYLRGSVYPYPDLKEKAEAEIKAWLLDHPLDTGAWYDLVVLNLHYFHDPDEALVLVRSIAEKLDPDTATILRYFLEDTYMGVITEELYHALLRREFADPALSACRSFYLFRYLKSIKNPDCLSHLEQCIALKPDFVHAYLELGFYYRWELSDSKKGQYYFYQAVASVQHIFSAEDPASDNLSIAGYFREMVYGTDCTAGKYEILKGYVKGDFPYEP